MCVRNLHERRKSAIKIKIAGKLRVQIVKDRIKKIGLESRIIDAGNL